MTKDEWLKRCSLAYEMGLIGKDRTSSNFLTKVIDALIRFEGGQRNQHQNKYWEEFVKEEKKRTRDWTVVLTSDQLLYSLLIFAHILDHPCQKCGVDPQAWHTRYGFCNHRKEHLRDE